MEWEIEYAAFVPRQGVATAEETETSGESVHPAPYIMPIKKILLGSTTFPRISRMQTECKRELMKKLEWQILRKKGEVHLESRKMSDCTLDMFQLYF